MENSFLIFTIVVLVISVILGFRKGILGVVYGMLSWVMVIALVYYGTPYVEQSLKNGPVYEKFYNAVYGHIENGLTSLANEKETSEEMAENAQDLSITDPESVGRLFNEIGMSLPWIMQRRISDQAGDNSELLEVEIPEGSDEASIDARIQAVHKLNGMIADQAAKPIAGMMIHGVSLLLIVILSLLATRIVGLIINVMSDAPVIGGTSRLLGVVWGLLCALLIIWLAMDVVACFALTPTGQALMEEIKANPFLITIFNYNPLEFLLQ